MVTVKVKSLWQGKVAVRDKYLRECYEGKKGLVVSFEGRTMAMAFEEIRDRIKGKSDHPMRDRFSNQSHYLIYFDWKPDPEEKNLFSDLSPLQDNKVSA